VLAPNERAASIRLRSVVVSPANVLIRTGKTTTRKMTATLELMPMPNQRMNSGPRAMIGVL